MVKFSVIIPCYNVEAYIKNTLLSVVAQTYPPFEVILYDDGSTDRTIDIIQEIQAQYPTFPIDLLRGNHLGAAGARNEAITHAKGDWISFLDSDDLWFENKLERVAQKIMDCPDANLICTGAIWRKDKDEITVDQGKSYDHSISPFLSLFRRNSLSTSEVSVRKETLDKVGFFDPNIVVCQDYELWLRLAKITPFHFISEPLSVYLVREQSVSRRIWDHFRDRLYILEKHEAYAKKTLPFYWLEKRKFLGKTYLTLGLELVRSKQFVKGAVYLCKGILYYPFRGDIFGRLNRLLRGF